jgi:hypothetical protein
LTGRARESQAYRAGVVPGLVRLAVKLSWAVSP